MKNRYFARAQVTLTEDEENELWSALFLTTSDLQELLEHVRLTASRGFIYSIFVFAAHTGARRSEIFRSQLDNVDLASGTITIQEMKRVPERLATRSVPMSPLLRRVLRDWIGNHPGGRHTIALPSDILYSRRKGRAVLLILSGQAKDYRTRQAGA